MCVTVQGKSAFRSLTYRFLTAWFEQVASALCASNLSGAAWGLDTLFPGWVWEFNTVACVWRCAQAWAQSMHL